MIHFLCFHNQNSQPAKHTAWRPRREELITEIYTSQLKLKRRWPRSLRRELLKDYSDSDITVPAGRAFQSSTTLTAKERFRISRFDRGRKIFKGWPRREEGFMVNS